MIFSSFVVIKNCYVVKTRGWVFKETLREELRVKVRDIGFDARFTHRLCFAA